MEKNVLHRSERLILTTIDILEELGIQGITTREIAKRQNVSEATIFRHFKNKNELLLAMLDYYIQYDSDIYQSIRLNALNPKEALRFLTSRYAEYFENYPAISAITQIYEVLRYDAELKDKVKEIQQRRFQKMRELIEELQKTGDLPSDSDSGLLTTMVVGMFREICFQWRLDNYSFSLKERTLELIDTFLNSFQKKKETHN